MLMYARGMKHLRPLAITTAVLSFTVLTPAASVVALPPGSVSREIHITAIVAPKRTVIINSTGQIKEIASNTEQDVMPDVYVGKPTVQSKIALTDELYREYRRYVPQGTTSVGIIYPTLQDKQNDTLVSNGQSRVLPEFLKRQ